MIMMKGNQISPRRPSDLHGCDNSYLYCCSDDAPPTSRRRRRRRRRVAAPTPPPLPSSPPPPPPGGSCGYGWVDGLSVFGKCYIADGEESAAGYLSCDEKHGGRRLCVGSLAENAFVSRVVGDPGTEKWLGLYQRPGAEEPDGGWDAWRSGCTSEYRNWGPDEPNDHGSSGEGCALLRGEPLGSNAWDDRPCAHKHVCVCEKVPQPEPELCRAIPSLSRTATRCAAASRRIESEKVLRHREDEELLREDCNKKRKCKKSKCDMCEATCKKPCKIIDCKDIMRRRRAQTRRKRVARKRRSSRSTASWPRSPIGAPPSAPSSVTATRAT